MTSNEARQHVTLVACAAGPAQDATLLVETAQSASWTVDVIATPTAVSFMDLPALERLTSVPVRSLPREAATPRSRTRIADGVLLAPATFNTINKLAAGIADNYALSYLAETVGSGIPVVMVPFVNSALASRLAYQRSLAILRDEGVHIAEGWHPHAQGTGEIRRAEFLGSARLKCSSNSRRDLRPALTGVSTAAMKRS